MCIIYDTVLNAIMKDSEMLGQNQGNNTLQMETRNLMQIILVKGKW